MKERPILFSGPMVRPLLDGRKTQTRRAVKFDGTATRPMGFGYGVMQQDEGRWFMEWNNYPGQRVFMKCPYGAPGDRLWVRETWNTFDPDPGPDGDLDVVGAERFARGKRAPYSGCQGDREIRWTTAYLADGEMAHPTAGPAIWRPSIHMPRWASRITLEVTEVRVQRLHNISTQDAQAEGCEGFAGDGHLNCETPLEQFETLWKSINGPASWDANPWVWAISFKRVA